MADVPCTITIGPDGAGLGFHPAVHSGTGDRLALAAAQGRAELKPPSTGALACFRSLRSVAATTCRPRHGVLPTPPVAPTAHRRWRRLGEPMGLDPGRRLPDRCLDAPFVLLVHGLCRCDVRPELRVTIGGVSLVRPPATSATATSPSKASDAATIQDCRQAADACREASLRSHSLDPGRGGEGRGWTGSMPSSPGSGAPSSPAPAHVADGPMLAGGREGDGRVEEGEVGATPLFLVLGAGRHRSGRGRRLRRGFWAAAARVAPRVASLGR